MPFSLEFSHVGIFVTDLSRMADFYTRVLGFVVSDRGPRPDGSEIAFMTRDPQEHHQVVLATGRPADLKFNTVNQISFRVDSLATLRTLYLRLKKEPIVDLGPVTHGNALSAYFHDPEGNRVELYLHTPWHVPQPHRISVDLALPDPEVWGHIERHVRSLPGFRPRSEWSEEMSRRIGQATARLAQGA
jgi:catechol 2,3-dioxygenase-like lactoylglutathione lyase family enzyme